MAATGRYIGTPNGIVLCADANDNGILTGRLYHGYSKEAIPFRGYEGMLKTAEALFDALGFPHKGTSDRSLHGQTHSHKKKEGMTKVMRDDELLGQHGDMGTFVIRVQHRQHSSWQGMVTYLDRDQTVYFRSALELIKIIDSTLDEAEQKGAGQTDGGA